MSHYVKFRHDLKPIEILWGYTVKCVEKKPIQPLWMVLWTAVKNVWEAVPLSYVKNSLSSRLADQHNAVKKNCSTVAVGGRQY